MKFNSQKSVFQFGKEYVCTNFSNEETRASGVNVSLDDKHIGSIIGINIPDDIDNIEENVKFDNEVIKWVVDNDK